MKYRLLPLCALCLVILLGACDNSGSNPSPTSTPPTQPTTAAQGTATPAPAAEQPSPTTAAEQPTATQVAQTPPTAPASQAKEPLKLQQVQVETNDTTRKGALVDEHTLNLPPGFHVKVFAADLPGVRWLGLSPDGVVYATLTSAGKVVTLPDADKDGVADNVKTFADGLEGVHGIAFKDNAVYVATQGAIIRLQDTNGDGVADKRDVLANDLPTGGGHFTRTIAFGPDGKLYVAAGSSCNVCVESNPKRAAISRYSADGKFEKVFASGLRNAVGIIFNSVGELWATDNGRDNLGDDIPPETVYNVKEDTNYGWPFCYGDRMPDKTQDVPAGFCEMTGTPAVKMQAHSAPLGLAFYTGDQFPAQLKGDLFAAFHGSWNRSVPTGYKVVRIRFKDGQPDASNPDLEVEDFATGWLVNGDVWGRPVDPMVASNGNLLVTDDKANAIYSIYYAENAGP